MTSNLGLHRRALIAGTVAMTAGLRHVASARADARPALRFKAIAFDGFPIIDPRPVATRAEEAFPGHGARLIDAWRTKQFEYTWLRTLSRRYADFWQVTEEALVFAANSIKLDLTAAKRAQLMQTFLELKTWPDAAPALRELKTKGIRMAFLANFTTTMLDASIRNAGLDGVLEPHLSTDRVGAYKPDPRAYQMALGAFGMAREEIIFAASAGWDAAGAKMFGYPTFWINRANLPAEELGVTADGTGSGLADLVKFVTG
jgi:2-haloacid dehalogenase